VTHKLLLADDSVTIQRVVELTFSGEDVQVVTVGDGEQAIARIPIERPDIVLADIGMPKRSGYDVAAFVKGRPDLSHIPVLLLAGAFEPVDDARAQQVKCDGVLVKPFEPQQVVSRVRELVDGARERSAAASVSVFAPEMPEAPPASQPEPAVAEPPRKTESKLDDYFQGLDAALAVLDSKVESRPSMTSELDDFRASEVPTLEKLLGSAPLRESSGPVDPPFNVSSIGSSMLDVLSAHGRNTEPTPPAPPDGGNVILDAFNALLAMEQGEPRPVARSHAPAGAPAVVTEELVDEVARRVVERLAPGVARDLVKQVVADVAERLIREEIARIKAAATTKR
jgi:CheY-like chemotaxis protein